MGFGRFPLCLLESTFLDHLVLLPLRLLASWAAGPENESWDIFWG